jgi:hypothetical protein
MMMIDIDKLKQVVIDSFNHDLITRDTGRDGSNQLGFIYDKESPFTVTVSVSEESLQIRSSISLQTPLSNDKLAMRVIREALQRARNQLNLYTDQV